MKMEFAPDNKSAQFSNFPRLKLSYGEKARILCVEKTPEYAWTHTLNRPALQDGKVVMQEVKQRGGDTVERMKMEFVGRPLCLGDVGVLQDKGVDVKNCPACAEAADSDIINPPDRRFAMHVIKYAVKSGSFELSKPFRCETVVWAFGDFIYNKLTDFVTEWGSLSNHDLLLGPCENESFQKYEIAISKEAAWNDPEHPEYRDNVLETFKENHTDNLESFCGRKVTRSFMEDDIQKVVTRWKLVRGGSLYQDGESDQRDLASGLSDLLSGSPSEKPAAAVAGSSEVVASTSAGLGLGDLLGGLNEEEASAPTPPTPPLPTPPVPTPTPPVPTPTPPVPSPQPTSPPSNSDTLNFEDLLNFGK